MIERDSLQSSRRKFMTVLAGAGAAWPFAATAQQGVRMRRIAVLASVLPADDPEWQARGTAFVQALQERGWTDGRNVRIEYRWGLGDGERVRKYAADLVAVAPDVLVAAGGLAAEALRAATQTLPIVFANVGDPVGNGLVASLARPGGNITGFMIYEFGFSAKYLELLKQVAPRVTRVAIIRTLGISIGGLGAMQAVAPSLGVELTPFLIRDVSDVNPAITSFARGPNDGLIVLGDAARRSQRDPIIALAAAHRRPAVYSVRRFVAEGGLISYGPDRSEPYRLSSVARKGNWTKDSTWSP
jgi:putative tryptophan/tyrosine transport system substrate-binding protein